MAPLPEPLALLAALGVLLSGCATKTVTLPDLPSDGTCCQTTPAASQASVRPGGVDFRSARRVCAGESPTQQYTIFTGFDQAAGGRWLFGCGSEARPSCKRLARAACTTACLLDRTCYLRFDTAEPFLQRTSIDQSTRTRTNSVVETINTGERSDVDRNNTDGETIHTNETDTLRERVNTTSDERKKRRIRALNITSGSLHGIGRSILDAPTPVIRKELPPLGDRTMGPFPGETTSLAKEGYCCTMPLAQVPKPLAGVTTLAECQKRCHEDRYSMAVRISMTKWACASQRLRIRCSPRASCHRCLLEPTCLTVFRISLALTINTVRRRSEDSAFGVITTDTGDTSHISNRPIGADGTQRRRTNIRNDSTTDVSGNRLSRQVTSVGTQIFRPSGSISGSLIVTSSTGGVGSMTTALNTTVTIGINDNSSTRRNLARPGIQAGYMQDDVARNVTENRSTLQRSAEDSRNATRSVKSRGDKAGELLPGLSGPVNGTASLTASERNGTHLIRDTRLRSTNERRAGHSELTTPGGTTRRNVSTGGSLSTGVEQIRGRNDTTRTSTRFTSHDPSLGTVSIGRNERTSDSVTARRGTNATSTADASRTLTTCAQTSCERDVTKQSRGERTNLSHGRTEVVSQEVVKTSDVRPAGSLPNISVKATRLDQARTDDNQSQASGVMHETSSHQDRGPGFQDSRQRNRTTKQIINTSEHSQEVKTKTMLRYTTD
ncbi:uncharacterized protein LOC119096855 isoform X2 [Pollicipes pollicipes]|uniref:uncharacterized protein LOC119096855 isoform X2 n=1 Tax=Pollicipes pollicipes TaxID=41117 RepID=UPI001885764A|nr:uncharacterized protein LOC119096855 isoform X2 [Pollicipes pollicipes]